MKLVPIRDLKINLSFWIKQVIQGNAVAITKHNQPVAYLSPAIEPAVHYGKNVGKATLTPALPKRKLINWFKFLEEDRHE